MKAAGAVCILLGAFSGRMVWIRERRRRKDILSGLRLALFRMSEEIRRARTPFPVLLERLAGESGEAAAFFHTAGEWVACGESLETAWRRAAESLPLTSDDRQLLTELGRDLRGDEEQVRKAVTAAERRLGERVAEMDGADTRRVTALVLSGAALLVILLY